MMNKERLEHAMCTLKHIANLEKDEDSNASQFVITLQGAARECIAYIEVEKVSKLEEAALAIKDLSKAELRHLLNLLPHLEASIVKHSNTQYPQLSWSDAEQQASISVTTIIL